MHTNQAVGKKSVLYGMVIFVSLAYLLITFLAPQASNSFNLSGIQILFLKITIAIPYIATWFFAAYGLSTLQKYIAVAKREDAVMVALLGSFRSALFWLVAGTMLVALVGGIKPYFVTATAILPLITIVTNYLYVLPSLIGFAIIYRGVLQLRSSQGMPGEHKQDSYLFNMLIVLLISSFYIYLIYTNPTRQFSSDPLIPPTYYLPDIMILLTIIFPIITAWWLGFSSAFTLSDLIPHLTREELYRGITKILYGIWAIIFTSILIQGLLSLGGTRLYSIGLGGLLLLIYIFIFLQAFGYLFIAFGSKDLRKSIKANV